MVRTSFAQPLWSASLFLTVPPFIVETARIVRCSLLHSLWRFLTPSSLTMNSSTVPAIHWLEGRLGWDEQKEGS